MAGESTKIITDFSQTISGLDVLDAKLAETARAFIKVGESAKKAGADTSSAFKTGAAQGVADAVDNLQKEFDQLKKSATTLKAALRGATDPGLVKIYATSIAQLELGMAQLEKTGKAAGVNLREANKQAGTGRQVFEGLFGAFTKVTLIVTAIQAVKDFVVSAVELSQQTDKATKSFTSFLGSAELAAETVGKLTSFASKKFLNTDDVLQAGKGLLAFGEGVDNLEPVLSRIADISAATGKNFNELVTIYGKARTSGVLYAEDINQLVDAGIPIIQEFAKQLGVSNSQVKKLASEGKISFEELQLAFFNLTKEGATFAGQAESQAETLSGVWKGLFNEVRPAISRIGEFFSDIAKGIGFILTDLAKGIKSVFGIEEDVKINVDYAGRDKYEQAKDDLYEQQRLESEAAKKRAELQNKNNEAARKAFEENEKKRAELRIQVISDGTEKEIAAENLRFQTLSAELKKLFRGRAELNGLLQQAEKSHKEALAAIYMDEIKSFRDAEAEYDKIQADALKKVENDKKERERILKEGAQSERDIRNAAIDIGAERANAFLLRLKEQGASEAEIKKAQAEFDLETQAARLRSEIEFQKSLLSITDAGDKTQIEKIQKNIELLKAKLGNVTFKIDNPDKPKTSIFSLLGLDPNDPNFERDKEALQKAAAQAVSSIQAIGQARLDAAQAAVEAADQEVQAAENKTQKAQEALDRELELSKQGFASNVSLKLDELAAAQKAEEEKKRLREKALQDQAKAQKTQIILDGVLQASNLVTASTDIIKGFAKIPIVGGVLGIAAVGLMLAAFIKQKAAALQAVSAQKFRHGGSGWLSDSGYVDGRTHEQGGHLLEVEHGEIAQVGEDGGRKRLSVVRRERVRDYFDLLDAANRNDKRAIIHHALSLAGGAAPDYSTKFNTTDNDIHIDRESVSKRVFGSGKTDHVTMSTNDGSADAKRTNQLLEMMLKQMMKGDSKETWSADGKTRTRGNVRTTYLN